MDFLQGQETLTSMEWALRAIIAFFFLVTVARALGQRTISQLRLLDFVIALVIGNIIAHPLSDERLGLKGSVITTSVLVSLYLCCIYAALKFPSLRKFFNSPTITLIKDGEILYKGLKKSRLSLDELLEELRGEKVDDVKKVALAIWESDGKLSVFLDPKYEAITPSHYKLKTEAFYLPKTIIKEGKIDFNKLSKINKNEDWVISILKSLYNTDVKNVLLATIDGKGNLNVFLYN